MAIIPATAQRFTAGPAPTVTTYPFAEALTGFARGYMGGKEAEYAREWAREQQALENKQQQAQTLAYLASSLAPQGLLATTPAIAGQEPAITGIPGAPPLYARQRPVTEEQLAVTSILAGQTPFWQKELAEAGRTMSPTDMLTMMTLTRDPKMLQQYQEMMAKTGAMAPTVRAPSIPGATVTPGTTAPAPVPAPATAPEIWGEKSAGRIVRQGGKEWVYLYPQETGSWAVLEIDKAMKYFNATDRNDLVKKVYDRFGGK
jgi:hypothetical protein